MSGRINLDNMSDDFKSYIQGLDSQLEHITNDVSRRSINVTHLFTEKLNDNNTSEQFYNAFKYCLDNGYMAYVPRGTYVVGRWNTPDDVSSSLCLVIPNGLDVIFEQGVVFKLKPNSESSSRVVGPQGNNNLYGHFEIDGSADTITNGNEHMAGLFAYEKENIYIESLYSYNCYGDNVQLTGSTNQGKNIIIDKLVCRKAGRKNLVFENTTNIHIKNAYLDNTEGDSSTWSGGGCLDIEPLSSSNECYYRIDRLETTGSNDFTIGLTFENATKFVLDIGTLIQHSGEFLSYALTINIDNAVFYNCKIHQLYRSNINIKNALFRNVSKQIIKTSQNTYNIPMLNIGNLVVQSDTSIEPTETLMHIQGANVNIDYAWIDNYYERIINTNATINSSVTFNNLYINNSGKINEDMTYLSTYGKARLNFNVGNVIIRDTRETLPKCIFNVVTAGANDGMNINNIINNTSIQTIRSNYDNFTPVLKNGGITSRRPTNVGAGFQYFDTTLKKPIWWNGTDWVDATGTVV